MQSSRPLVIFSPMGKRDRINTDFNLLQIATELGVAIETACGGNGQCGKCQINIVEGELAKYGVCSSKNHVNDLTEAEKVHIERGSLTKGRRLACCCYVSDDIVVDVPSTSQVQSQEVRKEVGDLNNQVDSAIAAYSFRLTKPNLYDQDGLFEMLKKALWFYTGTYDISASNHIIASLQKILTKTRVLSVFLRGKNIVLVRPFHDVESELSYGLAFDIGSTTIAGHIVSLNSGEVIASKGVMNPQIKFGEDVMARVSYVMLNANGLEQLHDILIKAVNQLISDLIEMSGVNKLQVLESVFVANPIMHHLFLGFDPTDLGQTPFTLATNSSISTDANSILLNLGAHTNTYILPCVAGHVGADAAAMMLAILYNEDINRKILCVDVGTNAEVILAANGKIYACSSPTGPAFEGAQISCGQRASVGAIERFEIDKETLEPRFKIIGCDLWSNESGFNEKAAGITISGVCGSGIIEIVGSLFLAGVITQNGVFNESLLSKTDRIIKRGRVYSYLIYKGEVEVVLTQNDIRQVQLAKAALFASIQLLMDKAGVSQLDNIYLAGAFGNHINPKFAMLLGMIPDCSLDKVASVGNAAGDGAIRALLSKNARSWIEQTAKRVHKIETAVEPNFQDYFIGAMSIPHKSAMFPNLSSILDLPDSTLNQGQSRRGNRRRRVKDK